MEAQPRTLRDYLDSAGNDPFDIWIKGLRDGKAKGIICVRLNRVAQGNFGDCEPVGKGVHELVINFGPGDRAYFGQDGNEVILLGGGDKSTQVTDIKRSDYNA